MALRRFIRAFPKARTRCCAVIILFDDSIISALIIIRFIVVPLIIYVSILHNQRNIVWILRIINAFDFLIYYEICIND